MKAWRQTSWGTRVAVDFFLNGTGSGLIVMSSALFLMTGQSVFLSKMIILSGLIILAAGLLVLTSELGRPTRAIYALSNLRTSWLSRGVLFNALLIIALLIGLFIVPSLFMAIVLLILSILTASYPSFLLHAAKDIELWHTPLIIGLFLFWAFAQGGVIIGMLVPKITNLLLLPMLAFIAIIAIMEGTFLSRRGKEGSALNESKKALLLGDLRRFTRPSIMLGLIIPFILFSAGLFVLTVPLFLAGGVLLFVGGFFFRYIILKSAYHRPMSVLHGKEVDKSIFIKRRG